MIDTIEKIKNNLYSKINESKKIEKLKKILEKTKTKKANTIFIIVVLIIYMIITFIGVIKHESWSDEAQAWLIARDLSIPEIWSQMRYEGHSCLWHLILVPFAKLGLPFDSIKLISWIFLVISVFLILKYSPFNKFTKLLIIFSAPFIYYYPCISREYCLLPLLISLISILYQDKKKHPYLYAVLLALLCNVHIIAIPFAGMLTVTFYGEELLLKRKQNEKKERKKLIIGAFIVFIGLVLFILQIYRAIFDSKLSYQVSSIHNTLNINFIVTHTKEIVIQYMEMIIGKSPLTIVNYIVFAIILTLIIINGIKYKKQFLIFVPVVIVNIVVHVFLWFLNPHRAYMILMLIIFWAWNYKKDGKICDFKIINNSILYALIILCIISLKAGYNAIKADYYNLYSSSKETAEYIEDNLPKDSVFLFIPVSQSITPIIAYLDDDDYKFYSVPEDRYLTYIIWDNKWNEKITPNKINILLNHKLKNKKNVYLITTIFQNNNERKFLEDCKKIYASNNCMMILEQYIIYKLPDVEYTK